MSTELSVPSAAMSLSIIERAIEKGIDAETMSRLVDLQERMQKSAAESEFNHAMQQFQGECPVVIHDAAGHKNQYTYATLPQIVQSIRPYLNKHGLAFSFDSITEATKLTTTCTVHHVAGHSRTHSIAMEICGTSAMSKPQMAASALTYGRRFALCAAFGIVTADTDDDCRTGAPSVGPEPGVNPGARPDPNVLPRNKREVDPETLNRFNALKERWKAFRDMHDLSVGKDEFSRMVCCASMMDPTNTCNPSQWVEADFVAVEAEIIKLEKSGQ